MNLRMALRKWHRWIGFPAALFLVFVSVTGSWLAATEFFGAEEALRERMRTVVSPVTTDLSAAFDIAVLERARAAVAVSVPGAPVDRLVWEFKGDVPTVVFYLGKSTGGEDRKVVVEAASGRVLAIENYQDKSFLLRLHSGEAFGDGGLVVAMLWGLSLLALSVTGTIIYLQLRRPNATGWQRVFWTVSAFALGLAAVPQARADSPFNTDDPNFSPGWEIKAGFTSDKNTGGRVVTDVLDWNYAIAPNVRLDLTTYAKHSRPQGSRDESGYGDTEFKIKWRFQDEDPSTGKPALGLAPKIYIPTANENRGLGDGVWRFQLPVQFGKTVGRWYHFAEAGYQWTSGNRASDSSYAGVGTLYSANSHWAFGTELFSSLPTDKSSDWQLLTTLGGVYTFNEHWQLKASVSHTLRDKKLGGSAPAAVLYLVWNF